ncbi:sarcosine oxidase subunit gamma [Bradyrhizobium liaoningense]
MADLLLQPLAAATDARIAFGDRVTIFERRSLALATVQARRGQDAALRERIKQQYQVELPGRPEIVGADGIAFVGLGPQTWLAMSETDGLGFGLSLRTQLGELASVSDQTGGYVVFRVGGNAARQTLAKGFPIDLDARAFRVGDAASTIVSHIGATIWRRDDAADGSPCFEISLFRSLAKSFLDWFVDSAAEFGARRDEARTP